MSETLELTKQLIARPSVTPDDCGCQDMLTEALADSGFVAEQIDFGDTKNLWLRRGTEKPLFVFLGHTDVVPSGPTEEWQSPPFEPTLRDGLLYGRGAADMKASLAAMVTACKKFTTQSSDHKGSIALLITSDEEGDARDGTVRVIETLSQRGDQIDWCLVGEPSSGEKLGDSIRVGRRGSLSGKLTILGVQGHVAYPDKAENPIHTFAPALEELVKVQWDNGNRFFPATSFQISNIHAGTGAGNVIPGSLIVDFNLRYSTEISAEQIKQRIHNLLDRHQLNYELNWNLSGEPFLTTKTSLIDAVQSATQSVCGIEAIPSTAGGTSDGRFVAPTGAEVVELGPINASIHKVNEHIPVEDIDTLAKLYEAILVNLLSNRQASS